MCKAAKFRVQVAIASSLDEQPALASERTPQPADHPPHLPAQVGKPHFPPCGRRGREVAMRKAAKFQAQVAFELPAVPSPEGQSAAVAVAAAPSPSGGPKRHLVPHPLRAKKALSSPRGQRALELAMRKLAEARAAATPPPEAVAPAPAETAPPPTKSAPARRFVPFPGRFGKKATRRTTLAWAALVVGLAIAGGLMLVHRRQHQEALVLAKPRPSLAWLRQAQDRAADGSFRTALNTVDRALTDSPENAALLTFKGDMHQSLLQFADAQAAYQQALRVDPQSKWARENLVLSHRLSRAAGRSTGKLSTLYGLHRAMMTQGRVDEAIAISNQLRTDHALSQATWQSVLDRAGLEGRVSVDDQGVMSLDLSGHAQPDLTLIRRFPVRRLSVAGTGLESLQALKGMPLEALDLSDTPVYDLAPLHGMPLEELRIAHTGVVDLNPLKGCPLRELDLSGTRVAGVEALEGMPLTALWADDTPLADLRSVAALPLVILSLAHTRVADLRPLQHLGLEELNLDGTAVADLSPLRGSALRELSLADTPVADLAPLVDMPLEALSLRGCRRVQDLRPLLSCPELEHLSLPPNAERLEALSKLPHLRFIEDGNHQADKPGGGPPSSTAQSRPGDSAPAHAKR